jgi:hypothetical protein
MTKPLNVNGAINHNLNPAVLLGSLALLVKINRSSKRLAAIKHRDSTNCNF